MAKTDWQMGDTVQPSDMNDIGQEINDNANNLAAHKAEDAIDAHKPKNVGLGNVPNVDFVGVLGLGSTFTVVSEIEIDNITRTILNGRHTDGAYIHLERGGTPTAYQLLLRGNANPTMMFRRRAGDVWTDWREVLHAGNTIVDSNGFIKEV